MVGSLHSFVASGPHRTYLRGWRTWPSNAATRVRRELEFKRMNDLEFLIDLHVRNPRQGPGSAEETRRAIELARLDRGRTLQALDIGCGTGASSLELARTLDANVTAVDALPAFVEKLEERSAIAGLTRRIAGQVGQMESLPFVDQQFDLIWSEGAIYNVGFAFGLCAWREFLRPGGVVAVTEITWTTRERPKQVEDYWAREYPAITTLSDNLEAAEDAGYRAMAAFFLPRSCWLDNYYEPLRDGFVGFLDRHDHSEPARRLVEAEKEELRLYDEFGSWYGYAFYVLRRMEDA